MGPAAPVPNSRIFVPAQAPAVAAPVGETDDDLGFLSDQAGPGAVGPGRVTSSPGLVTARKERGRWATPSKEQK